MNPLLDLFGGNFHPIIIEKESYLGIIAASSGVANPKVLSYHHQAVGKKGANLIVTATSMDKKIIEGLQHVVFKNVVGTQFHHEPSSLYKADLKLTTDPGKPFSPNELLLQSNSLKFHQQYWKDFSDKVKECKR